LRVLHEHRPEVPGGDGESTGDGQGMGGVGVGRMPQRGRRPEQVAGGEDVDEDVVTLQGGTDQLHLALGQDIQVSGGCSDPVDGSVLGVPAHPHPGVDGFDRGRRQVSEVAGAAQDVQPDGPGTGVRRGTARRQRGVAAFRCHAIGLLHRAGGPPPAGAAATASVGPGRAGAGTGGVAGDSASSVPGRARSSRIPLAITTSTDAWCTNIPIAMVTPPASTPASSRDTVPTAIATFCRRFRTVARARATASGRRVRWSLISATSAVSIATWLPATPIATPASAVASAG